MRKFLVLATLAVAGVAVTGFYLDAPHAQSTLAAVKPPALKMGDPLPGNLWVELAKAINPAVVNISTSTLSRGLMRDPFWDQLERFYGMPLGPRSPGKGKPMPLSLGTGFVIREDGLIITNAHVVRMADIVNVQFEEGSDKTYEAKVVGSDERSDIALLKIKPDRKLTAVALGNSTEVQVGEWVAAFGNPFGHGHTVTHGIVSSTGRALEQINRFPLMQTDAPINPGNSGGPLVNSRGLVIGVNSAIDARGPGIGFAIPIDEVKRILPELESSGRLRKGYIGVGAGDIVSEDEGEAIGAGVIRVDKNGPAAKAGLRYGDVIVEFNGKKVRNSVELIDAVTGTSPGAQVPLKVIRQQGSRQRTLDLRMTVAERPLEPGAGRPDAPLPEGRPAPYELGFSLTDLTPEMRARLGLPEDLKKPVITDVDNNAVAGFIGLQPGDVVLEVNRHEVSTAKDALGRLKRGENILKIARGNRIIILSVNR